MVVETLEKNSNHNIGLPDKIHDQEGNSKMVNGEESNVVKEALLSTENEPGSDTPQKQHTTLIRNKRKTNLKKINEDESEVKKDMEEICKEEMKEMVVAELPEREASAGKWDRRGVQLKREEQVEKKGRRQTDRLTDQPVDTQGVPNATNSEHYQEDLSNQSPLSCSSATTVDQSNSRTYMRKESTKLIISSNEKASRGEKRDVQNQVFCHHDEKEENCILRNNNFFKFPGRERNIVVESNNNGNYIERYTTGSANNMDRKKSRTIENGENNPPYVRRPHLELNFFNQRIIKNSNIPSFDKYCACEKNCADHIDGRNMYHANGNPGTNIVFNGVNSHAINSSSCNNFAYVNVIPSTNGLRNNHSHQQPKEQVEYEEEQLDMNSKKAQTHIPFISSNGQSQSDLRMNTANVEQHHVVPPYVHPLGNKEQGIRIGTYPKDRYYNKGKEKIQDQYYRIKLCPFLKKGLCQKGDNCSYAHSADTLRSCMNLMKTKICQMWLKNECRNPNCVYAHGEGELRATPDYFKTKLCKYFDKEGTCPSGDRCRHAHGQAELRQRNYRKTEFEKFSPKNKVSAKFTFHGFKNRGECPQYIFNMFSGRSRRKENIDRSEWNNSNETNDHNGFSNVSRYYMPTQSDENSNAQMSSGYKRGTLPDQMCRPEKRESMNGNTQVCPVSDSQCCQNQEKEIHAIFTVFQKEEKSDGEKNSNVSSVNVCSANYSYQREAPREEQIFRTDSKEEEDKENASHAGTPHLHHAVSGTTSSISLECDRNGKKEQKDEVVEVGMGNGTRNSASEASKPEQRAENQKERKGRSSSDEPLSERNQKLADRRKNVEMEDEKIELGQNEEQHPVGKASHSGHMNDGPSNDGDYKMLTESASGWEKKDGIFDENLDHSIEYMSSGQSSSQYMSIERSSNEEEGLSCGNNSPNESYVGGNQNYQGESCGQGEDENNGQMGDESEGLSLLEVEIKREHDNKYESVQIGNVYIEEYPEARRSETRRSFEGDKNDNGNVDCEDNGHQYVDENENRRGGNEKQRDCNQDQRYPRSNEHKFIGNTNEIDNCSKKVITGENFIQRRYVNNCPRGGDRHGSFRNFKDNGNDIQRNFIFMLKNQYRKDNDGKKNLHLGKLASCPMDRASINYGSKNFNYKYKKFSTASRYTKNFEVLDHHESVANVGSYGSCDKDDLNNGEDLINKEGTHNGGVLDGNGWGSGNLPETRVKRMSAHGEHQKLSNHNKHKDGNRNADHDEPKERMTNDRVKTSGEGKNCNDSPHRNFACKGQHRSFNNPYSTYEHNSSNEHFENTVRCTHTNNNLVNNSLHMQNALPRPKETYSDVCNSGVHRTKQNYYKSNGSTSNDMLYAAPAYPLNTQVNNLSYYNYNVSNIRSNRNNCYNYLNVEMNSVNMASPTRVLPADLSISLEGGGTSEEARRTTNMTDTPNSRNNRAHSRSSKSYPCSNQHRKRIINIQNMASNGVNMHLSGNQSPNMQGNHNRQARNCTSSNVVVGCNHHRSFATQTNTNDNCVHNGNSGSSSASNMIHNDTSDPPLCSFMENKNSGYYVRNENDMSGHNSGISPEGGENQNGGSGSKGKNPHIQEMEVSQNGGREKRKRTPHLAYSTQRNYGKRTNNSHFKNYRNYNNHIYTNQMYTNQVYTNQVYTNDVYAHHPPYGSNQAYYSNQVYTYQHPYSNYMYSSDDRASTNNGHKYSCSSYPHNSYSNYPHSSCSSAYLIYPYSSYPYSNNYPYDDLYPYDGAYPYGDAYPHDVILPYNSVNPYLANSHCDMVQPYGSASHYSRNHYYGHVEQFSGAQFYGGIQMYNSGQVYIDAQQYGDADQCANVQLYGGDHHYNGNRSGVYNGSYTNDHSYVYNQYPYNAIINYGPPYNINNTEEEQNGNRAPLRDNLLDSEEYENRSNGDENNANDTCQDEYAFDDLTKSASTEDGEEVEGVEVPQ
ncbi:zinc finger protein, putative [Plasmodium knowlesi strain H]|uniref:Zinc finger protein, putative n=3 Tax=Plasmodium knowlesi TaxID=5850 RepID=A0A5K1VLU7_PLAKH|nr:zinc finger protein, putative [Plasmodium knowlesi strain H]OTN64868.1 putative Zinc finger protein [Plasmodium knowlesi]CAA9988372.1 zinc finger protein, putative [Plasmodium knowlesi strain H]SBO20018.1 zinc finger protein, putative [Plasmodium knowlesi strain H]SBO20334.1 zinc finger protein, putative [Plasmodium knowlesi strain H]VVS77846.1 zinc finger protein, putative [Plasmodium knowlesi strain H]|eukprot:XP_002259353.1 hypothetical protein, conserved in Plasmodium species [Plasmodium knowlesi strain H]